MQLKISECLKNVPMLWMSRFYAFEWEKKTQFSIILILLKQEKYRNIKSIDIAKFYFILFFKAEPMVHGISQARSQIRAIDGAYTTATAMPDPNHTCDLYHRLQQT